METAGILLAAAAQPCRAPATPIWQESVKTMKKKKKRGGKKKKGKKRGRSEGGDHVVFPVCMLIPPNINTDQLKTSPTLD